MLNRKCVMDISIDDKIASETLDTIVNVRNLETHFYTSCSQANVTYKSDLNQNSQTTAQYSRL